MIIFVFLLWIVLNGRFNTELVVFGVLISFLVSAFFHMLTDYSLKTELQLLKKFPFIIFYIFNLIIEIIKASLSVMSVIILGKKADSVLVEFHSGIKSALLNTILANSITLTPGTYTVFQENDRFLIHCLMESYGDDLENSSFVKILKALSEDAK